LLNTGVSLQAIFSPAKAACCAVCHSGRQSANALSEYQRIEFRFNQCLTKYYSYPQGGFFAMNFPGCGILALILKPSVGDRYRMWKNENAVMGDGEVS
jgi:hypothetical protein